MTWKLAALATGRLRAQGGRAAERQGGRKGEVERVEELGEQREGDGEKGPERKRNSDLDIV